MEIIKKVLLKLLFPHAAVVAVLVPVAAALVSVLSLETAMLSAFGTETDEKFRSIITAATGLAVFASVLSMAVYMIIFSTQKISLIKKRN